MYKINSSFLFKRLYLIFLILLFCLVLSENIYSRAKWKKDFTEVIYDPTENTITFYFEFFDYYFGPAHENGYLRWGDFLYSEYGFIYTHLMRAETNDQGLDYWTWLKMRYKKSGAKLQLLSCYKPANGLIWPDYDDNRDLDVEVRTEGKKYNITDNPDLCLGSSACAYMTVKWYLGETYKKVRFIQFKGYWFVNGVYKGDKINEFYTLPNRSFLKSNKFNESPSSYKTETYTTDSKNSEVKVTTEGDFVVIKGSKLGENIKIYNASGSEVKSLITNSDITKIKLTKNQIYIVNIGRTRFKVTT